MTSSTFPLSHYPGAAPHESAAGAAPARPRDETARKVFSGALAFFLAIAVARVHTVLIPSLTVIPLAKLAVVILAVTASAALRREDLARAYRTPMARSFALIVALAVLGAPFALWKGQAVSSLQGAFLPSVFLFAIGSVGLMDRRTLQFCATTLILAIGLDSIYVLRGVESVMGRAMLGGGLDPNDTAALIVATIPIALLLGGQGGIARRVLFSGIALLAVAALVKTGSRGGVMGLGAMALALIAVSRGRQRLRYVFFVVVGTVVFGAAASDQLRQRFGDMFKPDYNRSEEDGRIQIWKRGVGYMIHNPVLGVGFANFTIAEGTISAKATDPTRRRGVRFAAAHNAYVQIGAELGVGGLLAFLTMIGGSLVGCWRVARRRGPHADPFLAGWATAAFVGLAGLSVSAIFLSLAYHPMVIFTATLCTAVVAAAYGYGAAEAAASPPGAAPLAAAPGVVAGWRSRRSAALVHTPPALMPPAPTPVRGRRVVRRR